MDYPAQTEFQGSLVVTYLQLGRLSLKQDQLEEARTAFQEARDLLKAQLARDLPTHPSPGRPQTTRESAI
jgi:hypothetical protein